MNMQETIAKESPRRIGRRLAAAGLALAALMTLGACRATGGGQIDAPVDSGQLPPEAIDFVGELGDYDGEANFGFNFTCEMRSANKALIQGEITYHDSGPSLFENVEVAPGVIKDVEFDPIRLHGTVDPMYFDVTTCEAAAQTFLDAAVFKGSYRSQETDL